MKRIIFWMTACFTFVALASCHSTAVVPNTMTPGMAGGGSPSLHDANTLGTATSKTIEKLQIPFEELEFKKVKLEIISQNDGRIYSRMAPFLRGKNIQLVEDIKDAEILLKLVEKTGAVNEVIDSYWWFWPFPPLAYSRVSIASQAKSEMMVEAKELEGNKLLFATDAVSTREQDDIYRSTFLWLILLPVSTEYAAEE
ncbi:MAG: hypothetical protein GY866_08450 [Proteobacteria bacterium]|nr:hypothetical protein [Pseudomonadota bacterium]